MSGAGLAAPAQGIALPAARAAEGGIPGARRLLWMLILASAGLLLAGIAAFRLSLAHVAQAWPMVLPIPAFLAIAAIYRYLRPEPRIAAGTEDAAQMLAIIALMTVLDYVAAVAGAGFAYRDAWLAAADARLGFDWPAYVRFVDARPWLAGLLAMAYMFMVPMFLVALGALAMTGRRARLQHFLLALWLALAITLAVFVMMPAAGCYAWFGIAAADLANLSPAYLAAGVAPALDALRGAGPHVIPLDDLKGLADFPSFHTAGAILFVWALWPLRRLRWPVLAANLLTLAATPVEGSHYLVDMLAGAVVAAAAIALAGRWLALTPARPSPQALR